MSLSDLPDEILGLISIRLDGFDNCFLWMASNSKLKERLVNNVITDIDIKYTIPGRFLWPGNFLKKLQKLSRLSVVVDRNLFDIPLQNIEFFPIETLKYLKLDRKKLGKTLKGKRSSVIKLNDLYPNLEHLEIGHPYPEEIDQFPVGLLSSLPPKLTTFISHDFFDNLLPDQDIDIYIASLPRSLTDLTINFSAVDTSSIDPYFLPPNLTSLTTNAVIEEDSFLTIPKTIKHLNLSFVDCDVQKLAPHLPTGLITFTTFSDSMIGESLAHLKHLEDFKIYFRNDPDQFMEMEEDVLFVEKYPPNLKKCQLDFDFCLWSGILPFTDINGLVELSIYTQLDYTYEFLTNLPQTITKLSLLGRKCTEEYEFYSFLPQNLLTFETNIAVIENLSLLPESLTNLDLNPYLPCEMSEDDRFPPKLEKLTISGQLDIPRSILKKLPRSLKHLDLTSGSMVDDEIIASFPRGLTYLLLATPLHLTDASAGSYPPNLKSLQLSDYYSVVIEMADQVIGQLPRSLKYLDLGKLSNLTDACIKDLPRQLIDLSLQECKNITWRSFRDLPKRLYRLNLQSCTDWTKDSLKDLPKYLESRQLGFSNTNSVSGKKASNWY